MPPKRGRGRGIRGRSDEPDPPGRGRGRDADVPRDRESDFPTLGHGARARGERDQDYPALDHPQPGPAGPGWQPRQPRAPAEVYAPPARRGRADQFPAASITEHAPLQQPPLPKKETVEEQKLPTSTRRQADLAETMSELSLVAPRSAKSQKKFEMAPRQPKGTLGRTIDLIANYFLIEFKDISIYHYDIELVFIDKRGKSLLEEGRTAKEAVKQKITHVDHQQKRAPGKQRCRQIITEMIKIHHLNSYNPVYDGQKNLYTTKLLPMEDKIHHRTKFTIPLDEEGRIREFEVIVKPVEKQGGGNVISLEPLRELYKKRNKVDQIPQEVIMAFDTVMCHRVPPFTQVQVGRSFFLISERREYLGEGLEIWFGYNQSVHLTQRGTAVLVNFAAKAFHQSSNVLDYASDILGCDITKLPKLMPHQVKALGDALSKVKVEVTHQKYPRKYPIKCLTRTSAKDTRFKVDDKTEMSVADYFRKNYKTLSFPNLPLLHMRTSKNTTFMPMEVCHVCQGQPKLGKLSGAMTTKMIRNTAITPEDRFDKIMGNANLIEQVSGQLMKNFGLLMELKFMQLQGRVLDAPKLAYRPSQRGPSTADPDNRGTWKMDGKQFFRSISDACSWMIISFSGENFCRKEVLDKFAETLCNCARSLGMNLERPQDIKIFGKNTTTHAALKQAKDRNVTFAVVVLSSRDLVHSYEEVKFVAEAQLHLLTQCMDDQVVVKKFNPQVATNVLLKINSKLGGVNHTLSQRPVIFSQPIIVIGADAAHSPRGYACPSIAAVVGSLDAFPSRYAVTCRVQQNPDEKKLSQEIIVELEDMVREILKSFLKSTRGKKPEKILFFRDGVSEGQFEIVLENEISAVQQACLKELDGFLPLLTFIVVQKRHQTRFRPRNRRDGVGRPGNVPPGTTVDTDVVHPIFFDFFLCSHEGIQGTSKPAHYTVLFDQNKLSSDELQKLCYHLCHMYVRCNRSISVPAPVMYADLACTRAKKYADWYLTTHADSVSSGSSGTRELPSHIIKAITDMGKFESGMFFV